MRIAGRDDSLGRPVLYGTTKKFLQTFGLKSLRDLPPAEGVAPPKEGKGRGRRTEWVTDNDGRGHRPPSAGGAGTRPVGSSGAARRHG